MHTKSTRISPQILPESTLGKGSEASLNLEPGWLALIALLLLKSCDALFPVKREIY